MHTMKESFKRAVAENDVVGVRLALSNELMLDPRGDTFNEMLQYAKSNMTGLFEADNGQFGMKPQQQWNTEYMYALKNELDFNFSEKKLLHYEQVAKAVLQTKAQKLNADEAARQHRASHEEPHGPINGGQQFPSLGQIGKVASIAGAVITVVGVCCSKTAVGIIGLAAVAAGHILTYKEHQR